MVRVIALLAQKGGSGKTTLAVHLAVAAAANGYHVVIADLDPQGSAASWSRVRGSPEPKVVAMAASATGGFIDGIHRNGSGLVIVDTAPHSAPAASQVVQQVEFVLIPCRPTAFDLTAASSSAEIAKAARRRAAFVLNSCPVRAPEVADARTVLTSYGFPVAPVEIGQRQAFARAVASGQAVTEFDPHGKAAAEITDLWKWIAKQV
jgi:chromosome partitioning protein